MVDGCDEAVGQLEGVLAGVLAEPPVDPVVVEGRIESSREENMSSRGTAATLWPKKSYRRCLP